MCGIAGHYNTSKLPPNALEEMIGRLSHRGPDNIGFWRSDNCSLAHARLSIIDLSDSANQPMSYDGWHMVYNGEVYNYQEVRANLEKEGYRFTTNADSEVVLKAFHRWGLDGLKPLRGMFAFALYNEREDKLWLVRDRIGVKPLYYLNHHGGICFASEPKALYPHSQKSLSPLAMLDYFSFGYIGGDRSIFQDIHQVLPGHALEITKEQTVSHCYWSLPNTSSNETIDPEDLESSLEEAFRLRMVSDVKVGVFLSGGIDSSLVTALLAKSQDTLNTYTIGFDHGGFDEAPYARKVAAHLGTQHHEELLGLEGAEELLHRYYDIYDEPFADSSGIPTALLSRFVRQDGCKVVLSADGGDELFSGYGRYFEFLRLRQKLDRMPGWVRRAAGGITGLGLKAGMNRIHSRNFSHRLGKLQSYLSAQDSATLYQLMLSNATRHRTRALLNNELDSSFRDQKYFDSPDGMMRWDLGNYVPDNLMVKVDRATMFESIEGRDPFLDHQLIEKAFTISLDQKHDGADGKLPVRQILSKHVPSELFNRPKQGFSIPIFQWFTERLDAWFAHYFSDSFLAQVPELNAQELKAEYARYRLFKQKKKDYNIERMWRMLSFLMWYDKFVLKGES